MDKGDRRWRVVAELLLLLVLGSATVALAWLAPAGLRDLDGLTRSEGGVLIRGYRDPVTGRIVRLP
jgi:hypothetical protein